MNQDDSYYFLIPKMFVSFLKMSHKDQFNLMRQFECKYCAIAILYNKQNI